MTLATCSSSRRLRYGGIAPGPTSITPAIWTSVRFTAAFEPAPIATEVGAVAMRTRRAIQVLPVLAFHRVAAPDHGDGEHENGDEDDETHGASMGPARIKPISVRPAASR